MCIIFFLFRCIHGHNLYVIRKLYPWLVYNSDYNIVGNVYHLKVGKIRAFINMAIWKTCESSEKKID